MSKCAVTWRVWQERLRDDGTVDQAIAEFIDNSGLLWIHSYLVWPHLTIYATVSGPAEQARDRDNWALNGLRTLVINYSAI